MSESKNELAPAAQIPIVIPPLDSKEVLSHFNKIQELKRNLIDAKTDMMKIAEKDYILKSGWRKLAFAFNLTDQILREEKEDKRNGDTVWRMWVKVTAPNGREAVGVAAASTAERKFTHGEHDPYALCHTRAKNRAISDILGLGEVSAEEMIGTEGKAPPSPEPTPEPKAKPTLRGLKARFGDEVSINEQAGETYIKFPYNCLHFNDILAYVKEMGARWDPQGKVWILKTEA